MKELLQFIILLLMLFLLFSGFELTAKPFSIKFPNLWAGIGFILIIIGSSILIVHSYQKGKQEQIEIINKAIEEERKDRTKP